MNGKYGIPEPTNNNMKTELYKVIKQIQELNLPPPMATIVTEYDFHMMELTGMDMTGIYTLRTWDEQHNTNL